jgi:predicted phosphoribosyltransferase/pimeloyl-ACP methyl ester carboxylesterase
MTEPARRSDTTDVRISPLGLDGILGLPRPAEAEGIVLFAHGSGSGRLSPRNNYVAAALRSAGLATLLFDLLTDEEAADRRNVFDVELLAERLTLATVWIRQQEDTKGLLIGYFGASTGAAAALVAAARTHEDIAAIVSRGGRPDMAGPLLGQVRAPTLLIVGGQDAAVLELNRKAFEQLRCQKSLEIVPGATHLFEEPGALDQVIELARQWFTRHLDRTLPTRLIAMFLREVLFADRSEAGCALAQRLLKFKDQRPVVLALPRGGVPVGFEVARALDAPLDLILVRKIGAPFQPELAVGAVVDGGRAETIINEDVVREFQISESYIAEESARQLDEIERRRRLYLADRVRVPLAGRTAIVVDDGIATGATMEAALHATRRANPKRLVLATPAAPPDTLERLRPQVDEVVCLATPRLFGAIGVFYEDFRQVSDEEVVDLLRRATLSKGTPTARPS